MGTPGVDEDAVERLARTRFGIETILPYQRFAIESVLDAARDRGLVDGEARCPPAGTTGGCAVTGAATPATIPGADEREPCRYRVVILPTGTGKSLCFQLPALLTKGLTLAVYPLLSLMEDQRRRLEEAGVPCVSLRGGMSEEERREARRAIGESRVSIAIANPEILSVPRWLDFLSAVPIAHIAIDEAHCVVEWGETFRPAYAGLGAIIKTLDPATASAFTATASPGVLERMASSLFGEEPWTLVYGDADRPNLRYSAMVVGSILAADRILRATVERPAIFFAGTRDRVRDFAARAAGEEGRNAVRYYHAGLSKEARKTVENGFRDSSDGILYATCAYGMGVDKKNVRTVAHLDLPPSCEAYLQEAGRAGRDGRVARAILVVRADVNPEERGKRDLLEYARDSATCRRSRLLAMMGQEDRACSGCDVCDGTAFGDADADRVLLAARANRRRFTREQFSSFLSGSRRWPPFRGRGYLEDWQDGERAELLETLIATGALRVRKDAPFRGMIDIGRTVQRRLRSCSSSAALSTSGSAGFARVFSEGGIGRRLFRGLGIEDPANVT